MRWRAWALGAGICGCKAEAPAPVVEVVVAAVEAAPEVEPAAPVVAAPVAAEAVVIIKPPERVALDEARRLFKAKDAAGAWRAIEPFAQAARGDGGLLCEAGFIAFHAEKGAARGLIQRGIEVLSRDSTGPGRKRRAMCLYNLALVQEQEGALGEAVCSLRRSQALRANKTAAGRQKQLEARANAGEFKCAASRVARARDVRAQVREYADASDLTIASVERQEAGEFTIHTAHLEQGELPEDTIDRFSDAEYVIVDRGGALAPLGVLAYVDETVTFFRSGASVSFEGVHPSPLGTLLIFELDSWYRGDPEALEGVDYATHSNSSLLVCRWDARPGVEDLVCAQVPIEVRETAEVPFEDVGGSESGTTTDPSEGDDGIREWAAEVGFTVDEAKGEFVFELMAGDAERVDEQNLPLGRIGVTELFERWPAEDVGLAL
jgi:hypothetical protein